MQSSLILQVNPISQAPVGISKKPTPEAQAPAVVEAAPRVAVLGQVVAAGAAPLRRLQRMRNQKLSLVVAAVAAVVVIRAQAQAAAWAPAAAAAMLAASKGWWPKMPRKALLVREGSLVAATLPVH